MDERPAGGRIARVGGVLRSLAIYHAIPGRQRRLRRFYRQFLAPGELVFDLGAHVGNRTRAFRAIGCRVVAVEPQAECARLLRLLFRRAEGVAVVEAAVAERAGEAALAICTRHPTLSTTAAGWRARRETDPRFAGIQWSAPVAVPATTLDDLIARFGPPAFVKIDVEGAEPHVLAGLSRPIPTLSFEYLPGALEAARACVTRLSALGGYRFNWSAGESYRLASAEWLGGHELAAALESADAQRRSGDVYARLDRA